MPTSVFLDLANAEQFTGAVIINVNGIATTSTDGLSLINGTAATAAVPVQRSPRLRFTGSAWNSVGLAAETDSWIVEDRPVSVAGATNSAIFFSSSIAGAAYSDQMNLNSAGTLSISHKVQVTGTAGELVAPNDGFIYWLQRAVFSSPADAQLNVTNNATSIGVGVDVGTDAVLKVRTRAQTGYATVDCLGLKASGAAGFNGTVTPVTTITVVNGIVTNVA